MNHHCHANDCATPTEPKLFMCLRHWRMVPKRMQDDVWAGYRDAPRNNRLRDKPYLEACANAVEYVARLEDRHQGNSYRRLLDRLYPETQTSDIHSLSPKEEKR